MSDQPTEPNPATERAAGGEQRANDKRVVPWDEHAADALVAALERGAVCLVPTDTVYGLAVRAESREAVARLASLKGRDAAKPVAVLVASAEQAAKLATLDEPTRRLLSAFWPGALTIVARRRAGIEWSLGGDAETIGLRCPADALLRTVIETVGPIAATSANLAGDPPVSCPQDSDALLRSVHLAFDGGTRTGPASTVLDLTSAINGPRIIREGPIGLDEIMDRIGPS